MEAPELVDCGKCVDLRRPEREARLKARIALVEDRPAHLVLKAVALYVEFEDTGRVMIWHEREG